MFEKNHFIFLRLLGLCYFPTEQIKDNHSDDDVISMIPDSVSFSQPERHDAPIRARHRRSRSSDCILVHKPTGTLETGKNCLNVFQIWSLIGCLYDIVWYSIV